MFHEFKEIIKKAILHQEKGLKNVLVTVVDLEGSSYRKPGVRMLISEDKKMVGAVSGGCVEKEILQRSTTVFRDQKAKIITYDGRYRLGCEGILYILMEPFFVSSKFISRFSIATQNRESLKIKSTFVKEDEKYGNFKTEIEFEDKQQFSFHNLLSENTEDKLQTFKQLLKPSFRLLIIGAEHDAVKLCQMASLVGWQVDVFTSIKDTKNISYFSGANTVTSESPETIDFSDIDSNTGIIIMNHSYVQDLKYLLRLVNKNPAYLGILGATKRRNKMFNELFEYNPEISEEFLDRICTPAGLNLGAKTPEEIAVSIIAEILSVINNKEPFPLKTITGKIHQE